MKQRGRIWMGCAVILCGLIGAAYPAISNYVFENRADSMVYAYEEAADGLVEKEREELLALAQQYNDSLRSNTVRFYDPFGEKFGLTEMEDAVKRFADRLALDGTGVIGTVEVPAIDVKLPIYADDTYEQALERGTALVSGTSIPIGGEGTHAVISGHTGLNTAKIFTDLIGVEIGDQFYISILGDTLAYEVDEINIVDPYDFAKLQIEPEKDYCTLLTCTPYGQNTHRLLVRGVRVEYVPEAMEQISEEKADTGSQWWSEYRSAIGEGLFLVGIIILVFLLGRKIYRARLERREKTKGSLRGRMRMLAGLIFIGMSIIFLLAPEYVDSRIQARSDSIRESMVSDDYSGERKDPLHNASEKDDPQHIATGIIVEKGKDEPQLQAVLRYNESLQDGCQSERMRSGTKTDVWEESEAFGTIRIPAIDVDLPLYVGSSEENLAAGAAVLEGTSLPIGGSGTNSVISGHRGWKGAAFFKEIESVSWGDEVIITNPWETLIYEVTDVAVIDPDQMEPLLIQADKDMITLLTCHPYRSPRNMRYVLYANRKIITDEWSGEETLGHGPSRTDESEEAYFAEREAIRSSYGSSAKEIRMETWIRKSCAGCVSLLLIIRLAKQLYQSACKR